MPDQPLTLMAVLAHPDDEIFSAGGVFPKAAEEGIHTVLVCCTRGEAGQILDPDLDPDEARERLADIREEELREACRILKIDELRFLGYRDSGMAGTPENEDPRSFHRANFDEATERLVIILRETRPQVMIAPNPNGDYGHPDHIAAHRVAVAAFDAAGDPARFAEQGLEPWQPLKLYFTAFPRSGLENFRRIMEEHGLPSPFEEDEGDSDATEFTVPDEEITTYVDARAYAPLRLAAMRAHRTQIKADDPFFQLPQDVFAEAWPAQTYIRARSLVPAPEREDDLFAGLRSHAASGS